ncbi:hypothetical protein IE53DRAFT_371670 [Violaceomyces palustris]|uniref:Uncharacterized protein n=1 Tax=Violaceomyces palustris TaxID=1673888 RepID=A0ACD0NN38_9BASI|nr:hypothetical protein IE53DRAFT_371670 [Violaceomyces palustris]
MTKDNKPSKRSSKANKPDLSAQASASDPRGKAKSQTQSLKKLGKRKASPSLSDSGGEDHEEDEGRSDVVDREEALKALGQAFLQSFELPSYGTDRSNRGKSEARVDKKKGKRAKLSDTMSTSREEEEEDVERDEIDDVFSVDSGSTDYTDSEDDEDDEGGHSGVSDDDHEQNQVRNGSDRRVGLSTTTVGAAKARPRPVPETIVFGGETPSRVEQGLDGKRGWKAFMSSKIEKVRNEEEAMANGGQDKKLTAKEEKEEKQMESNDRILSNLLSTTLFAPGSESSSGGKRKLSSSETIARIMELSSTENQRKGQALGRGWGDDELKRKELSKMPASIRQGIRRAAGERREKEKQTAKELGIWHPSLKKVGNEGNALERGFRKNDRERVRGIGLGVGKFSGGQLKLSGEEIERINGPRGGGGGSKRGGRGGRGGGGGKRR